jgi:hypothetical protein
LAKHDSLWNGLAEECPRNLCAMKDVAIAAIPQYRLISIPGSSQNNETGEDT